MDATERALVGTALLLVVFVVMLMAGYFIPPDPPPNALQRPTSSVATSMPGSQALPEQDFVAELTLEALASRR